MSTSRRGEALIDAVVRHQVEKLSQPRASSVFERPDRLINIAQYVDQTLTQETRRRSNERGVVAARDAAIWLMRRITKQSLCAIGRFYKKHHTSILTASNRAEAMRLAIPDFAEYLERAERDIREGLSASQVCRNARKWASDYRLKGPDAKMLDSLTDLLVTRIEAGLAKRAKGDIA